MGEHVGKNICVCSKHFTREDYLSKGVCKGKPKLKRTAVPTVNLPKSSKTTKPDCGQRTKRYARRQGIRNQGVSISRKRKFCDVSEEMKPGISDSYTMNNLSESEKVCVSALLNLGANKSAAEEPSSVLTCANEVQVTIGNFVVAFSSTIQTEKHLNSLTGIVSFKLLDTLVDLMKKLYRDKKVHVLDVKDSILLVFMKLKLGLAFDVLSFFFKTSPLTCCLTFNDYIDKLSNILKNCYLAIN